MKKLFGICLFVLMLIGPSLYSQNDKIFELLDAIKRRDLKATQMLIEADSSLINKGHYQSSFLGGTTYHPINYAFKYGTPDIIDYLIANGANIDLGEVQSALLSSSTTSNFEILVSFRSLELVERYFYILSRSKENYVMAIKAASDRNRYDTVRFLLSKGEEILIKVEE